MLKSEVVQYYTRCSFGDEYGHTGSIKDHEEADIMRSLMGSCGVSGDEIDEKVSWEMNGVVDERKVRNIASKFQYKIVAVEVIKEDSEYGIVYDDEIEATYEENYEIVSEQFLMNGI
jgi:hypothetical protein